MGEYEGLKRFLYKKLFVLRPEFEEGVRNLSAQLNLTSYVGVHIRRGDKISESGFFRHIWEFAAEAERLCAAVGAMKIFVASDDGSVYDKFRPHIHNGSIEVVQQPR